MLEWTWTFISVVAMVYCLSTDKEGVDKFPDRTILGLVALVFAFVFSWPMTGDVARAWLHLTIPQQGSGIHELTVFTILGLVYLAIFVGLPMLVIYIKYRFETHGEY